MPPALPPLVRPDAEPGMVLSGTERTRYARHLLLPQVGVAGQARLRDARVLVVGAGGLGSPAILYLAAAGVGTIGIVDDDHVETTNLQRQILHGDADVGSAKTASAAAAVAAMNPAVRVVEHRERLTRDTAPALARGYDLVLDGADNFPTRYAVSAACVAAEVPHVWGSIYRFDGQVSVWWAGRGPCYRCVFPDPPPDGAVPSCATGGVLGVLCGAVGSVMATEAVKLLMGIGEPLVGRLLIHDALAQTWGTIPVVADPACPGCGSGLEPERSAAGAGSRPSADVPEVSAVEAARMLRSGLATGNVALVDVREAAERDIAVIEGARHIPLGAVRAGAEAELPRGIPVIVHCKTGGRSAEATALLRLRGVDARNLRGGILAWSTDVDPEVPTY